MERAYGTNGDGDHFSPVGCRNTEYLQPTAFNLRPNNGYCPQLPKASARGAGS